MASFPIVIIVFLFWLSAQCLALSLPSSTVQFEVGQTVEVLCPRSPERRKWDRISWERDNGQFITSGHKLVIENAAAGDAGDYLCRKQQFSGGHYSDTAVVHLIIKKKAEDDTKDEAVDDTVDEESDVTTTQKSSETRNRVKKDISMSPKVNESTSVLSKNETDVTSDVEDEEETPKNASSPRKDSDEAPNLLPYKDKEDEKRDTATSMPPEPSPMRTTCLPNQIKCNMSHSTGVLPGVKCVYKHWLCDGENDCLNGWDEENCNETDECYPQMYNCKNSKLKVPMGYRCDDETDCASGDDEENCLNPSFTTPKEAPRVEQILESIKGQPVDLKCSAKGLPSPVIIWRHNGQSVTGKHSIRESCANTPFGYVTTESILSVTLERDGDAGYYTCEANNNGGRSFSPDYLLRIR